MKGKEAERSQFDFQICSYICKAGTWCLYVGIVSLVNRTDLLMGSPDACLSYSFLPVSLQQSQRKDYVYGLEGSSRVTQDQFQCCHFIQPPLLEDIAINRNKLNLKRFWLLHPHGSRMNVSSGASLSDA